MSDAASSAGLCSTCGKYAEKRYGGEGKYPPECLHCWTRDLTEDVELPRDLRAYADREPTHSGLVLAHGETLLRAADEIERLRALFKASSEGR